MGRKYMCMDQIIYRRNQSARRSCNEVASPVRRCLLPGPTLQPSLIQDTSPQRSVVGRPNGAAVATPQERFRHWFIEYNNVEQP